MFETCLVGYKSWKWRSYQYLFDVKVHGIF